MAIRRLFDSLSARREKQSHSTRLRRGAVRRPARRQLGLEVFEERTLFAVGPQLISVIPNEGSTITNGETLNVAPTQLTFQFQAGESFNLPGTTTAAQPGQSLLPSSGTYPSITITEQLPTGPVTVGGVTASGGATYTNSPQTALTPGAVVVGNTTNEIVYRFANDLPDGNYTITVSGLTDSSGNTMSTPVTESFSIDYGAQVTAVVPQPVSQTYTNGVAGALSQSNNEIDVYFNDDPLNLASATNPANYELINVTSQVTSGTASNAGETIINPVSATYSYTAPSGSTPAVEEVKLTFAPGVLTPAAPGTTEAASQTEVNWQLRIGNADPIPVTPTLFQVTAQQGNDSTNPYTWVGSSAATAANLGNISGSGPNSNGEQTLIVTGIQNPGGGQPIPLSISNATDPVQDLLQYPGTTITPGHREIPKLDEDYVPTGYGAGGQAVAIAYFNFDSVIGTNNTGVPYYNFITPQQETDAEQILAMYGNYLGIQFVLSDDGQGFTIATGDPRAVSPTLSPTAVAGIATLDSLSGGIALVNEFDNWGSSAPGGSWFTVAMHEIGHVLGLDHADNTPALTIMNGGTESGNTVAGGYDGNTVGAAAVYPGDIDIVNGQYILPPDVADVNMFQFTLTQAGTVDVQTIAQRLANPSVLQTDLRLFVADPNNPGQYDQIAQDERYFGNDSNISLTLPAGTYYIGVSSVGNASYNPAIPDSGGGGNTQGDYELEIQFTPTQSAGLTDAGGQLLDGNADFQSGGVYDFWFNTQIADTQQATDILYVDKTAPQTVSGPLGSITNPYTTISTAIAAAVPGDIVRIEGNDADGKYTDGIAYEIGYDLSGNPLPDGASLQVPKGVTLMIDAGAILKLNGANISVGTVSQGVSHANGSVQVLGTPQQQVYLTSFNNTSIGASDGYTHVAPKPGDWGGIVFYSDADNAAAGVFDDYVDEATLTYGGGQVTVNSQKSVYDPIDINTSQPTVTFDTIYNSADAAMSADPNSFANNQFFGLTYTQDYSRIGPTIFGNILSVTLNVSGTPTVEDNSINGMFIRIATVASGANAGASLTTLTVSAQFDDPDIVYVLSENLLISGALAGSVEINSSGQTVANPAGGLVIDPGVVVKLNGARIETQPGNSSLIAEGTAGQPIIFTSLNDDTYGAGGTFQTNSHTSTAVAAPGDWGGILYGPVSTGSLDYVSVLYGGGTTTIEGGYDQFNALEIDQARVRVADSLFEYNASGASGDTRNGRGPNGPAVIYVLGAQPVLLNNTIENNSGAAISINVNSLNTDLVDDPGRSTGFSYGYGLPGVSGTAIDPSNDTPATYLSNMGPLINGNELGNNSINGLLVSGGVLTTQVVFDETSIVYVVESEITVPDVTVYGGLTIESSATASLVVKLLGATAGFTATGEPGDINTRIGGSVDIVGTPSHPVILTSLNDNSVGAGVTPTGAPDDETGNNPNAVPSPGDWRSVKIDEYSNDNNVAVVNGFQQNTTSNPQLNLTPSSAQYLGQLAPNLNSGDDTNRLGFQVDGTLDQPSNVDVYSFTATPGTQVFMTIDRTSFALGSVLELVDATGAVLAQAYAVFDPTTETYSMQYVGLAQPLQQGTFGEPDLYSINPRDASMSVILPSNGLSAGQEGTYYVRVRSASNDLANINGGLTTGDYDLQIKLADTYEWAGSEVEYTDINYATNGVQVLGQPDSSPLIGDSVSTGTNNTFATAEDLGNPLVQSENQLSVSGNLNGAAWYKFELNYNLVQLIGGTNSQLTWSEMFKVSYADGLAGPQTTLGLYDSSGDLLFIGRNSDVADNEPPGQTAADANDLTFGSFGSDPFIGSIQLNDQETYYLEVLPGNQLPATLDQTFVANSTNTLTRLEPIDSVARVAQDEIVGGTGVNAQTAAQDDQGSTATVPQTLSLTPTPYNLGNVVMYLTTTNQTTGAGNMYTVNPLTGELETAVGAIPAGSWIQDVAMRNDGELYGITSSPLSTATDANDNYEQISTTNGATTLVNNVGISTEYEPAGASSVSLADIGITFNALSYVQTSTSTARSLYAIGNINTATTGLTGTFGTTSNLLYSLNATTGVVNGGPTVTPNVLPSNPIPLGQVVTGSTITFPTGATISPANTTNPVANPADDVMDGQTVTINGHVFEFDSGPDVNLDPNGGNDTRDGQTFMLNGKTFEFHSGQVVVINGAGAGVGSVSQYDTVTLTDLGGTQHVFQFVDSGVTPNLPGAIPVVISPSETNAQIAASLAVAINTSGTSLGATAVGNRVSLANANAANPAINTTKAAADQTANAGAITIQGSDTVPTGDIAIPFQEFFTTDQMGSVGSTATNTYGIVSAVNNAKIGVTASYAAGDYRITFYGATTSNLATELQNPTGGTPNTPFLSLNDNVITGNPAAAGVAVAGDIPVKFGAGDSANQLATDLATAINTAGIVGLSATANGDQVTLTTTGKASNVVSTGNGTTGVPTPFQSSGAGHGGNVTGMADLNGTMYAVDANGDLFSINTTGGSDIVGNFDTPPDVSNYLATFTNPATGNNIQFAAISDGPPDVDNGAYANLLFATDTSGNVYALNPTTGALAPIFANGASYIYTGVTSGVTGIAFSTLDYNLWHETALRSATAGHGVNPSADDVLSRQPGAPGAPTTNYSMYFGLDNSLPAAQAQPGIAAYGSYASSVATDPDPYNTYNVPGGAQGSLTTSTFSLAGYSTADDPTLYFTYFLDDGNNTTLKGTDDSFRVFISDDGSNWTEVATNNDVYSTQTITAELPQNTSVFGGTYAGEGGTNPITQANTANQQTQPLFNNNSPNATNSTATFRQARIDLGDFAGDSNLELMFDFSSYGSMGIGNVEMGGTMVSTPAGNKVTNNDSVTVGSSTFALDVGYVLGVAQDGAQIPDGTTFSITGPTGTSATFQLSQSGTFTNNNYVQVPISDSYSAQQVALAIQSAIENSKVGITVNLDPTGTELELGDVGARAKAASIGAGANGSLTLNSLPSAGSTLINVDYTMSANTVAQDLANAINANPATANDAQMDGTSANDGATMQIVGATVTATLPYSTTLPGDSFGDANNSGSTSVGAGGPNYNRNALGNSDNQYEGVYLDDIIIGLAGRGEMVTGSTPLTAAQQTSTTTDVYNLPPSPLYTKQTYSGNYQLEMQRGSEYGANPPNATKPGINLGTTFNINARLTQGFSMTAPSGAQLYDGESFSITDGEHLVTFVYTTSPSLADTASIVYIPFSANQSADQIANSIVSAVNNSSAITQLQVEAGTIGLAGSIGDAAGQPTAGSQVNFFSAVQVAAPVQITAQAGSSLINGQSFQLSDGGDGVTPLTKTFEFNSTGQPSAPGNIVIKYSPSDSAATVAGEIVTAINASGMDALASLTLSVAAPAGSSGLDGTTFTITNGEGNSKTFEFLINASLTSGDVGVHITAAETASQVASAIVTAISASGLGVVATTVNNPVGTAGTPGNVVLQNIGGITGLNVVDLGAVTVTGVSLVANSEPNTTQQTGQVPLFAQAAANLTAGQTFDLSDGVNTVVFQYVTNAANVTAGDTPVVVSSLGAGSTVSASQVAIDLAAAINSANFAGNLNVTAIAGVTTADANEVYLTASDSTGGGIYVPPSGAQISNTQTFTVTDGFGDTQTFEFDLAGTYPQAGNISIPYTANDSSAQIGALIKTAINNNADGTLFFVSASQLTNGNVVVSGGTIGGLTQVPAAAGVNGISLSSAVAASPTIIVYNLNPTNGFPLTGDSLNVGTQGYTIIYADKITNSLGWGIEVGPGARITGGSNDPIASINLNSGGSGYLVAPTVTISAPPAGGIQATATATVNANGVVTGITITNPGSGYTSAPTVSFTGTGTGATATAEIDENSEPGPVRNLTVANSANLVPGISLEDNLLVNNDLGGIQISGDPGGGPSPFVRVVNNTIYGADEASLTMTAPAGADIKDGETFTVTDAQGNTATFEFVINAAPILGDIVIPILGTETNQQIAAYMATAINGVGLGTLNVTAAAGANGTLQLVNAANVTQVTTALPSGPQITDGEQLTIVSNTGTTVTFEFQIKAAAVPGDVIIKITGGETSAQIGADIIAALAANGTQVAASLGAAANTIQFLSAASVTGTSFPPVSISNGVGPASDGIDVINDASPTIINNLLANNAVAINVDASSQLNGSGGGTVEGTNGFQGNTSNGLVNPKVSGGTGTDIVMPAGASSIFVDAATGDFYLAQNITVNGTTEPNPMIDAGLNSLQDRPAIAAVEQAMGIALSPIIAPAYDMFDVLRQNDPLTHPNGNGSSPYIDLGAIEHADFTDPIATLTVANVGSSTVTQSPATVSVPGSVNLWEFTISLADSAGQGMNPGTVTAGQFTMTFNGTTVNEGTFYTFYYDATSNTVTLLAPGGQEGGGFPTGTYVIKLTNSGPTPIADLANNPLAPNNGTTGTTTFTIAYGVPTGQSSGVAWQNPTNKYDVNDDGVVNPLDVLILINALNSGTIIVNGNAEALPSGDLLPSPAPATITYYYNVTGATPAALTPADALAVINYLNSNPPQTAVVAPAVTSATASTAATSASSTPAVAPQVTGPVETVSSTDSATAQAADSSVTPAVVAAAASQVSPAESTPSTTAPIGQLDVAVTPASTSAIGASGSASTAQQAAVVNTAPSTSSASATDAQQQAINALMSSGGLWQQPLDSLDNVLSDIAADVQASQGSTQTTGTSSTNKTGLPLGS